MFKQSMFGLLTETYKNDTTIKHNASLEIERIYRNPPR